MESNDAIQACTGFGSGWGVAKLNEGSLVCTKDGRSWKSDCNSCESWRLLVWEQGADEFGANSFSTSPNKYYGGHTPCELGDNLPYCGSWRGNNIRI